jgi:uncharacterized membrane protein
LGGAAQLLSLGIMRTTSQSGMNIFELVFFILNASGALIGGRLGYTHYGVWGAIVGAILGVCAGLFATYALTFVFGAILSWKTGLPMFPKKTRKVDDA